MINKYYNIIVLGCGGTGSILIPLLARFLYSQQYDGHITLVDGDEYSESNLERQIFGVDHINMNKAEYQGNVVAKHIPSMSDQISIIDKYLSQAEIEDIVDENCVVFNCTDNKAARKFVEDRCLQLENCVHICCGNEMKTGQVQISLRVDGEQVTPSIYDRYPNMNSNDDDRSILSCEELAALPSGGQLICANATSAVLALNCFVSLVTSKLSNGGKTISHSHVCFHTLNNKFETDEIEMGVC